MTSDVKGWEQLFYVRILVCAFWLSDEPAPGRPDGCSRCSPWVGSPLPGLRRVPASCEGRAYLAASARRRGFPHTGAASLPMDGRTRESLGCPQPPAFCLRSPRHALGHGPQKGPPCPGQGDDDLRGMLACGHQLTRPCAEPSLGFPAERVERCGERCQAQGEGTTDLCWLPVRPGAFAQRPTRVRMPSLGHAALTCT